MSDKKNNLFTKILNFLIPSDSPDSIKKKKLKAIAKTISKTKYGKWYRPSAQEVTAQLAQLFFTIYKVVGQGRPMLSGVVSSKILKDITVETSLSAKQKKLLENLSEETIKEKTAQSSIEEVTASVKSDLKLFVGEFDSLQTEKTDSLYENLDNFIHFVLFDYYFLLKKFDSAFQENNLNYVPKFQTIRGEYVLDDLKEFASVLANLKIDADWKNVFEIIKTYKNVQPVNQNQWKKLLQILSDLVRSNILDYLIQHISEDIFYKTEKIIFEEKVTDVYISNLKQSTAAILEKLQKEQKSSKAAVLVKKIFGTDQVVSSTKYYTADASQVFLKKGLQGFIYAEELGYLKSFLIEYAKTEIRSLCDLFLVRGNWGGYTEITADYSNSFHELMQLSVSVSEFDDKLSDGSDIGVKFRTLLSRMEREKEAGRQAAKLLSELNDKALDYINLSIKNIIVIGNNFKNIISDYDKPRRELIQNWKEIEQHSDDPIRERLVNAYKKIYDFIALMQLFNRNK